MAVYNQVLQYTFRDTLASGDPEKVIYGAYLDGEFSAIHEASTDAASLSQANAFTNTQTFADSIVVGSATGGAQGNGTINAVNLYVNGVAVGSGAGTVSSVGLTESTGAITITGSPVTSSGTLAMTANTFTSSVPGIVPASGGGTSDFLRADGSWTTPTFSLTASYTVTGNWTFTPASGQAIQVNGNASTWTQIVTGNSTTGESYGLQVQAGTNSSDAAFLVSNQTAATEYFKINGDGTSFVATSQPANGIGFAGTPFSDKASSVTATLTDRGTMVYYGSSGYTYTIPESTFSAGDVISIMVQGSGYTLTIAQGSGFTIYWANGSNTTGNRTLTGNGMATLVFTSASNCMISGGGLS